MKQIIQLQNRIREVKKNLSKDIDITTIIHDLLTIDKRYSLPIINIPYPMGYIFYRARVVNDLPELTRWKKSDFWEVPTKLVSSYGRINSKHESVFYLSSDVNQTLKEIRYKYDRPVVVSAYMLTRPINSVKIGATYDESMIDGKNLSDEEELIKCNLISDFFNDIFSYPVGIGTEYLYKFSNSVFKNFYDLPDEVSQAWSYSAVENPNIMNVAFKNGDSNKYLRYIGSVCMVSFPNSGFKIPFYFSENYKLMFNYGESKNDWLNKTFNFNYTHLQ